MHLEVAVRRMTACGLGGISEFWREGEVVASQFLVFGRDLVGQHLFGAIETTSCSTQNALDEVGRLMYSRTKYVTRKLGKR
jgi:hypothetical protein